MATVYLSPIGNDSLVDANGVPYSGGKIYTYAAGSTTAKTTYTSSAGTVAQANPIVLDSRGQPASPIWLLTGAYKFVLTTSAGATVWTIDDISGINDVAGSFTQWVASGLTPTYIGATSFSLVGDQTSTFQIGRRVQTTNTGGTVYSTITNSVFGAVTTVTVVNDSGTLDSGLSAVSYALLSATNNSLPASSAGAIFSNTYTPTITGVANVTASTPRLCTYSRTANAVTVSGQCDIDPTLAAPTLTQFGVSLPVASSLTTAFQCGGTGAVDMNHGGVAVFIEGDAANDRAQFSYNATDVASQTVTFSFTYQVI